MTSYITTKEHNRIMQVSEDQLSAMTHERDVLVRDRDKLVAENERLREFVKGKGCDPDIVLRNKRDAEKYRSLMYDNEINTE